MNISVVISAYNEEKVIEECLKSVQGWADEIVFIDNESSDSTAKIAKKYTEKVFTRPNNKMLNINKNFGFEKAKKEWILSLDADERVTDELKNEIKIIIQDPQSKTQDQNNAYKIPRKNIIFGKWIEHTGWYPDYQTRLFKKGKGKFEQVHNHEQLAIQGETAKLKENMLHEHYNTIDEFLKKTFFTYTDSEAQKLEREGYKFKPRDTIKIPFQEFLSRFFARSGYKDGLHGLVLALLMAFYHFVVIIKVWERKKFPQHDAEEIQKVFKEEVESAKAETDHWMSEKNFIKHSPLKKAIQSARRKLA